MDLLLQLWGGSFYLLNKILFSLSEGAPKGESEDKSGKKGKLKKNLRTAGWLIYILGVPAWVIILVGHNNWIAASLEAGAIPAMLLGLYNSFQDKQRNNRALNSIATLCTYSSLAFGLVYSLVYFGGITSITQVLEIGAMVGFLLGSYYLAKDNPSGWLLFILMNLSMASLMYIQEKPILMFQQLFSLSFVCFGYFKSRSNSRKSRIEEYA